MNNQDRDRRQHLRLQTQDPGSDGDRLAVLDQDEVAAEGGVERAPEQVENEKEEKVTWMSLPHKKQLIVLTLARLSEPLVQTSLQVRFSHSERLRGIMERC